MNKFLLLLIVFNLTMTFSLFASFPPGGTYAAPIDGGVTILAIAGAAYGISKMRKKTKEKL